MLEVTAVKDTLDEKPGSLLRSERLKLAAREGSVEDAVLATPEAQPRRSSAQRLDIEVRWLGLGGEVVLK